MKLFNHLAKDIKDLRVLGLLIASTFLFGCQSATTPFSSSNPSVNVTSEPSIPAIELACSESKDSSHVEKAIKYVNAGGVLRKIGNSKYKQAVRNQIFYACEPPQDIDIETSNGSKLKRLNSVTLANDRSAILGIVKTVNAETFQIELVPTSEALDAAGRPIRANTSIENLPLDKDTTLISLFEVNLVEQPPSLMSMMGIKLNGSTDYLVQIYDTKGTLSTKKDDMVKIGVLDVVAQSMVVIDEYSPNL
jgi:hypothetical protein